MDERGNEYGFKPKYHFGDRVRIWVVYKRPVGTVTAVVDPNTFPIKYMVRYTYEDGREFHEEFEADQLTLFDKRFDTDCNCNARDNRATRHDRWCSRVSTRTW